MSYTPIDPIPTALRSQPQDVFDAAMAGFMNQLPTTITQMNGANLEANTSAAAAAASAVAADLSADDAVDAAAAAAASSNAVKWVSGTNYADGFVVWAPSDHLPYRKVGAGVSVVDPKLDPTGWAIQVFVPATPQYLHVRDEKSNGTDGGSSTGPAYNDRNLNTVVNNTITGASLASNQITLPAGTYKISAKAPCSGPSPRHRLHVYNVTNSVDLLFGESRSTVSGVNDFAICNGFFALASTKVIKLRHFITTSTATTGLGISVNGDGVEVYSSAIIEKVA